MFKLTIHTQSQHEVELEQETSLLTAARKAGADLNHRCGGHARCGSCKVTVVEGAENLSEMGAAERRVLTVLKATPEERLACQAWAKGDATVKV